MLFEKLAQRSEGEFYRKCKETQSTRKHVPRLWLYLKEKIEEKKQLGLSKSGFRKVGSPSQASWWLVDGDWKCWEEKVLCLMANPCII